MRLILCVMMMVVGACVNAPQEDISPVIVGDTSNLLIYYSNCEHMQPSANPTWCDFYEGGGACCTWDVAGFYEEWCQYPDNLCWEMNGGWQG